jgi:ribosomal RNA-processing protein 9
VRADEDIESGDSNDDSALALRGTAVGEDGDDEEKEDEETAGEKKLRMTKEYLKRIEDTVQRNKEEEGSDEEDSDEDLDDALGGRRVARLLKKKQLVESGRRRLSLAAR